MKSVGYFILLGNFALTGCSFKFRSCASEKAGTVNHTGDSQSDCTVTYSDSKKETIDLPKNCRSVVIINSGSGNLTVRSEHTIEMLTVINTGSNNANLHDVRANKVVLEDRGSGILQVTALEEIKGYSQGSGSIIISGPGNNNVVNKGSGTITWSQF